MLVLGMGGSAIAGDVVRALSAISGRKQVDVARGYDPPPYLGESTLAVACSHSGNTEETLSAFETALDDAAQLAVVTTGGRLRALATERGLAERVRFTGRLSRAEVMKHLRASHVFALVSTHEGFSHVLLEAMQAGAAVVATDVGGNREVLEDGRCGRLVQDASPEGIASALVALHGAPGERARLCEAAERRARESWPAYLEGTLDVLERARARARP
ncbi:MAG TPA: glycosyltransferase [Vicinamibacteria bacterium]